MRAKGLQQCTVLPLPGQDRPAGWRLPPAGLPERTQVGKHAMLVCTRIDPMVPRIVAEMLVDATCLRRA